MLTSPHHELVKLARSLLSRKGRERSGCFLVEGPRALETVVDAGAVIEAVLAAPDAEPALMDRLSIAGVRVERVTGALLTSVSDVVTPDGCVAVVRSPERTAGLLPRRVVVLDEVRDPGNVGTLLRTADAVGAGVLLVGGCADPLSPKVARASAGAVVRVPWWRSGREAAQARLQREGHAAVVLSSAAGDDLYAAPLPYPLALIAGNEAHGPAEWDTPDRRRLPMRAGTDSLNVGVATAVALYESVRQYGEIAGGDGAQ